MKVRDICADAGVKVPVQMMCESLNTDLKCESVHVKGDIHVALMMLVPLLA